MGRGKKRHSRVEPKEKPTAKEEPLSSDVLPPVQSEPNATKAVPRNITTLDSEPEELDPEVFSTSLSAQGDKEDYVDVLGNGLLLKKVLDNGLGAETRPGHGDVVEICFKGWLENGTLVEDVPAQTATLGDGDVIQALELALPLAELEERFELISDARFAYGSRGREPDVPGDSKLRYEVRLLSARDPPCYSTLPCSERVAIADGKRERGNYYYRREEYAFAVNSYNKALKILTAPAGDFQPDRSAEDKSHAVSSEDVDALEIKLQNNLAATQLKIQAYDAAIKSCDAVLRKDPSNFKALFRKGKALLEQGDVDEAIPILKALHDTAPTSAAVAGELQRARVLQQRQQERWSRVASNMFPQLNRPNKLRQSKVQRVRGYLCSFRLLFLLSVLVALGAVVYAWHLDRLPSVEPMKRWFASFHQQH